VNIEWCYRALMSGFIILIGGCVAPIQYEVSIPQEIPAGAAGKIHNETITLEKNQYTLSVQVQAYNWDGQYLLPPLGVWLAFDSRGKVISIDPMLVTLQSDQSNPIQAVSFLGPSVPWQSPRALSAGCGPRFYRSGIGLTRIGVSQESVLKANVKAGIKRPTVGPVNFQGRKCFMFWYKTDPMPDHVFVLRINGISVNKEKAEPLTLRFKKGVVSTIKGFP